MRYGEFEVLGSLAEGGMGVVYLARDPDGRIAALKVMKNGLAEGRIRFEREVAALRQVTGPHVAELLGVDLTAEPPYLATRYVNGLSLADTVARGGPLAGPALDRLGEGLLDALTAIHAPGLVHRDLTPRNIVLEDGRPVVIDLGIARLRDVTRITLGPIGTVTYMAPEVLANRDIGPAADVFAWGAVMAFAATGRACFEADSAEQVVYRVLHESPDLAAVPAALRPVVARALAKDPADRPTVDDLRWALRRLPAVADLLARHGAAVEDRAWGRAEGLAYALHAQAEAAGDTVLAAHALLDQARATRFGGSTERAEPLFAAAARLAADQRNRADRGWALDGLGVCQQARGDSAAALATFTEVLAIAEEIGDELLRDWARVNLGTLAAGRKDYAEAEQWFQQARDNPLPALRHDAVRGLAHAARDDGRFAAAADLYTEAQQIAEPAGMWREAGWDRYDHAEAKLAQQPPDPESARSAYQDALEIARDHHFAGMMGWSLNKLAAVTDDPSLARTLYAAALEVGRAVGDRWITQYAREHLGLE